MPPAGVVATSGGNHGAAVAYVAKKIGIPATIFVQTIANPAKIDAVRSYGTETVVGGDRYADALAASEARGKPPAPSACMPFFGQGTLGLELYQQSSAIDTLLVAVGGGGLISGIVGYLGDKIRIVAVESDGAPTLHAVFDAGRPVDAPTGGIAADSLAPKRIGELVYPVAARHVSPEVILVSDDDTERTAIPLGQVSDRRRAGRGGCLCCVAIGQIQTAPGRWRGRRSPRR